MKCNTDNKKSKKHEIKAAECTNKAEDIRHTENVSLKQFVWVIHNPEQMRL